MYIAQEGIHVVISMSFTLDGKPEFAEHDAGNGIEKNKSVYGAWHG